MDVLFEENLLLLRVTVGGRRGMAQQAMAVAEEAEMQLRRHFILIRLSFLSLFLFGDEDRVRRLFFRATKRDGRTDGKAF